MADSYLLGQIANPAMADIAGALDIRAKRMADDEARRRAEKSRQIAGQALSSGLREGSLLKELAENDPERYIQLSKVMGINPANGAEGMSLLDDINEIYVNTTVSPENGLGYVKSLIDSRQNLGLDTQRLQGLYDNGSKDPVFFGNLINHMQKTFNPERNSMPAEIQAFNEMTKGFTPEEKLKAQKIKARILPGAQGSADITIAEQGLTEEVGDSKSNIEGKVAGSKQEAKSSAERRSLWKDQGLAAAENIPTLTRAIELQDAVETGGGINALRSIANYLGVSSEDAGELNSLFGQNILGQLKSIFGGNPTEGEREALGQAQASFDQTGKINKRVLQNALKLANLRVDRGRRAAEADEDSGTIKEIESALSIKFGESNNGVQQGGSGEGAMTPGITGKTETAKERLMRLQSGQ